VIPKSGHRFSEKITRNKKLGADERDALAGDIVLRLAAAQHAHAILRQAAHGVLDVIDAEADVVKAALRIALEELGNRRIWPRRLDQLDLGGAELDIGEPHALLGVLHARSDRKSVGLMKPPRGRLDIGHDDGNVVQTGDHGVTLVGATLSLR